MDEAQVEVEEQPLPPKKKRWKKGCLMVGLIVLATVGWWVGPVVYDFVRSGILGDLIFKKPNRNYEGTSIDNLRAMHMGMMLYHESEEMFPQASGWMDAIESRIQTGDMAKGENLKKLVNPDYLGQPGKFGYAMNDAASRKYRDDIPEPDKTPLIFDSSDLSRNAHGEPQSLLPKPPRNGLNRGVSVNGQLLTFK